MAVPNGAKRRQNQEKSKSKRFRPNGRHGGFGPARYGPSAMMRDFVPGPFPAVGPRFPPGIRGMYRGMGPMGFMPPGPPGFHPRLRGPPPPPFMHRPPFLRPPFPRPLPPNPGMRPKPYPNLKLSRSPKKPPNKPPDALNDLTKPWVTDAIRAENAKRQQLVRAARQSRKDADWALVKACRAKIQAMLKEAKDKYLSRHPEKVVSEAFQINPDPSSKGVDFTEDLKF